MQETSHSDNVIEFFKIKLLRSFITQNIEILTPNMNVIVNFLDFNNNFFHFMLK